jgi:hypothetical protein
MRAAQHLRRGTLPAFSRHPVCHQIHLVVSKTNRSGQAGLPGLPSGLCREAAIA